MGKTFRADGLYKTQKKVRDGRPTRAAASCRNHGGCPYCQSNRMHRHNKKLVNTTNEFLTDDN